MTLRKIFGLVWGGLVGCLTLSVGSIAVESVHPVIAYIQFLAMMLILPGLIAGAAIAGNVHAFFLGPGALINALLQFGLAWLLFPFVSWLFSPLASWFKRPSNTID